MAEYVINIQKFTASLRISNGQSKMKDKTIQFIRASKIIKYIGINLTQEVKFDLYVKFVHKFIRF